MILTSLHQYEARRSFLNRLRKELDFDKTICEMEGISVKPFINAIRHILREYDKPMVRKESSNQMTLFDCGIEQEGG